MIKGLFRPPCSVCEKTSATIEIVPPNEFPEEFASRDLESQERYRKYRDFSHFYLTYSGPGGGNGTTGDEVEPSRAANIVEAFSNPNKESIRAADFFIMLVSVLSVQSFTAGITGMRVEDDAPKAIGLAWILTGLLIKAFERITIQI